MNDEQKQALEIVGLFVLLCVVLSVLEAVLWMHSPLSCRDPELTAEQCLQMLRGVMGGLQAP